MKSCAEYKGLIDSHSNLDETQQSELASHIEECRACSEYKAEADRTAKLFRELQSCLAASDQSDRAYEAFTIRLEESGRQVFWALAGAAACMVAPVRPEYSRSLRKVVVVESSDSPGLPVSAR